MNLLFLLIEKKVMEVPQLPAWFELEADFYKTKWEKKVKQNLDELYQNEEKVL